jgi:hypothetical protein
MNANATTGNGVVYGRYNRNGYEVWLGNHLAYSAGNHVQDLAQPALCEEDRLPLRTIRQFCIKTAREIAAENAHQPVCPLAHLTPPPGQQPSRSEFEAGYAAWTMASHQF